VVANDAVRPCVHHNVRGCARHPPRTVRRLHRYPTITGRDNHTRSQSTLLCFNTHSQGCELNSIIIPHRNRNQYLHDCLWSIARSAEHCGVRDYEVVVVDNGSVCPPTPDDRHVVVVAVNRPTPWFNKPLCLNLGIEHSRGDILTFLDADAIVGKSFIEGISELADPTLTRLCYRVRYTSRTRFCEMFLSDSVDAAFRDYDSLQRAFEGYGDPERNTEGGEPVFGNSQFSITRHLLGDLRFNERFDGRGFEDLWLIREIWRRYGSAYKGKILTDPDHALIHVKHGYESDWHDIKKNKANFDLYHRT
jgi:glycosyltransferase involved in cell wall biosynthesis